MQAGMSHRAHVYFWNSGRSTPFRHALKQPKRPIALGFICLDLWLPGAEPKDPYMLTGGSYRRSQMRVPREKISTGQKRT